MILDRFHSELGWPSSSDVLNPPGAGPRVLLDLASRKIGDSLRRLDAACNVDVGVLARNPAGDGTETPFAIICSFDRTVPVNTIREAHRLAWNFSHTPLLVTLEPHLIRVWTCYEEPSSSESLEFLPSELSELRSDAQSNISLIDQAIKDLDWLELLSGRFFERYEARFQRDRCADRLLLSNLKEVRRLLIEREGLDEDICHDLLARLIFIQFLWDRKDSSGRSALSPQKLAKLHKDQVLRNQHQDLESLFRDYHDTYRLFLYLNEIFNGDLFPGSGQSKTIQRSEWAAEKRQVTAQHLEALADFVSGKLQMRGGQRLLWREYTFDVIPLEFISSIYEEFVSKQSKAGTVYTPPHLVDFMLDQVLPWNDSEWDLKILDPACGSGIFLVKAYQRLIHRWKRAHQADPSPADLRKILTQNIFGVDLDPHAVRVASFSLYLAMCDEIDPKYYWSRVSFPPLRNRRIVKSDFFADDVDGIRTDQDSGKYDLVVGNPPWGRNTLADANVEPWRKKGWELPERNIGPLFIVKAAQLVKTNGLVSLLQPSGLLTNTHGTAQRLRRKLFTSYGFRDVVNLSCLRFALYKRAIGPSCIVTLYPEFSAENAITFMAPKEMKNIEDNIRIQVELPDIHLVDPREAAEDPTIWSTLTWGGARDQHLVKRLRCHSTLRRLEKDGVIKKIRGLNRGATAQRKDKQIVGMRILEGEDFPGGTFLHLDARKLARNSDPHVERKASTDYSSFAPVQLFIKLAWRKRVERFRAALVGQSRDEGVLCSQSYLNIHTSAEHSHALEAICVAMNSRVAVYFLMLTSGRMATYRPSVTVTDLKNVPIPSKHNNIMQGIKDYSDVDVRMCDLLGLSESERVLIDDLFDYTLPDFKGDASSPGRRSTRYSKSGKSTHEEEILKDYCLCFLSVLRGGFGSDKRIGATIFTESNDDKLPVRMVSIRLDGAHEPVQLETMESGSIKDLLSSIAGGPRSRNVGHGLIERVARIYTVTSTNGRRTPIVYLVKPDRCHYWTRSMAMHDADSVAADILCWQEVSDSREPGLVRGE